MSLRISSLDPNVPRAGKDCRVCNRRRIRCDRTLPTCQKCRNRKLQCPGYGLRFKWIPTEPQSVQKQKVGTVTAVDHANTDSPFSSDSIPSETNQQETIVVQQTPIEPLRIEFCAPITIEHDSRAQDDEDRSDGNALTKQLCHNSSGLFNEEYGIDLSLTLCPRSPLPEFLQDASARRLLHHYDVSVAATMVWVDSPENPWRNTMLPLAIESPPLLLSILALAAEHLLARMRVNSTSPNSLMLSRNYRDKALELLAHQLRTEVQPGNNAGLTRQSPSNSTLATILVQCYLETVQSSSALWQVHLKAARTMIRHWMSTPREPRLADLTTRFLMREVFVIDAFATTTMFDDHEELPDEVMESKDCTIFIEYLQVIRNVTAMERRRNNDIHQGRTPLVHDVHTLQAKFEYTRNRSLRFSRRLNFGSESLRYDFTRIIEIFHHAGLIYSFQALVDRRIAEAYISYSLECLFDNLRRIPDSPAFAQDIVWPLFIAGTECQRRQEDQKWIERKLQDAMQSTGFQNCQVALEFLQLFWTTDNEESTGTWLDFAREYAKMGITFLVY